MKLAIPMAPMSGSQHHTGPEPDELQKMLTNACKELMLFTERQHAILQSCIERSACPAAAPVGFPGGTLLGIPGAPPLMSDQARQISSPRVSQLCPSPRGEASRLSCRSRTSINSCFADAPGQVRASVGISPRRARKKVVLPAYEQRERLESGTAATNTTITRCSEGPKVAWTDDGANNPQEDRSSMSSFASSAPRSSIVQTFWGKAMSSIKALRNRSRKKQQGSAKAQSLAIEKELKSTMTKMRTRQSEKPDGQLRSIWQSTISFVDSEMFDFIMGFILIINAAYIGFETDYRAKNIGRKESSPAAFQVIGICFCVVFTAELILRMATYGFCKFFTMAGWGWSWFDTFIVAFTIVDEVSQVIEMLVEQDSPGSSSGAMSNMSILRMLRLARIGRLVRLIHLVPALHSMASLIIASMSSFLWTCCLLLIVVGMFAVFFTELANQSRGAEVVDDPDSSIALFYGDIMTTVLTLVMAILGGDDWRNFLDVYVGHYLYVPVTLAFCMYVAFGTLVMLNLVTGVFVEGAQRIIREDEQRDKISAAARIFIDMGVSHDHTMNKDEFASLLASSPALADFLLDLGIESTEAEIIFEMFDRDGSGDVSLTEFITSCLTMGKPATAGELYTLRYEAKNQKHESIDEIVSGQQDRAEELKMTLRQELRGQLLEMLDAPLPPETDLPQQSMRHQAHWDAHGDCSDMDEITV